MDSLDTIVDQVIEDLDLNERVRMANWLEPELDIVEKVVARCLAEELREAGFPCTDQYASGEAHETMKIVKAVWAKLQETHRLRVVK